jgi:methylase of polypeptide subunit release factors
MAKFEIFPYREGVLAFRRDDWMLQDIVHGRTYEPYVIEAFMETLTPQSRVLDLGANVGTFTVAAARRCEHVYAVEMVPENAKLVAINAQLNGLANVTVWPCGVADQLRSITFPLLQSTDALHRSREPFLGRAPDRFNRRDCATRRDQDGY